MAIVIIGSEIVSGAGSGINVTTPAFDATGANFAVAGTAAYDNGGNNVPSGLTDTLGSTWHPLTEWDAVADQIHVRLWWATLASATTGYQVTTVGNNFGALTVMGFSGVDAYEQESGNTSESPLSSIAPGALTAPGAGALYVTIIASPNSGFLPGISAPFSAHRFTPDVPAVSIGLAIGYLIDGAATSRNPTWADSNLYVAAMAQFNAAGGTPFLPRLALLGVG